MITWALTGGAVILVVVLEGTRRRIDRARHDHLVGRGRQVWRVWIATDSWPGLAPLPRAAWVLDLVPLTVEVTADRLVLTPPRRYRAIGVREQEVPFTKIRRLDRRSLGRRRPGGLVSSRTALAVVVVRKSGLGFELVFATGGDEFLSAARSALD